jgi:hypothetical protein
MNQTTNLGVNNDSGQPAAADLILRARELLPPGTGKIEPKSVDEVARHTHLLFGCIAKEQDDAVALQCLALIGMAILRGSKETAKRKPKAIRWAANTPPSLQVLASDEERRAVIKLLPSATSSWVAPYAFREAPNPSYGKDLVGDLVKWACKSTQTNADFIVAFKEVFRGGVALDIERTGLIFKAFLKCLTEAQIASGTQFSDAFLDLAIELNSFCIISGAASKQRLALQTYGLALVDTISSKEPAVLFDPKTQQAIISLSSLSTGWSHSAEKLLTRLAGRMISISLLNSQIHGVEGSSDIRSILALAGKTLPLENTGKLFSAQRAIIKELLQPFTSTGDGAPKTPSPDASIQEQIATLLLAWDAFRKLLPSADIAKEIDFLVESISAKASVERFGQVGEIQSFHPMQHHLLDSGDSPPSSITIEVAGVRSIRTDGSFRVLIKALAAPAK